MKKVLMQRDNVYFITKYFYKRGITNNYDYI